MVKYLQHQNVILHHIRAEIVHPHDIYQLYVHKKIH